MTMIVETSALTKQFQKYTAVSGVNLQVRKGEIYGFLGPNGAGKSTTIRMLLGLTRPTAGTVKIFGKDLASNRIDILQNVGSLVENPSYYPHLTAAENLEVLRKVLAVEKTRIDTVLKLVRLTHVRDKKVKGFSLGMKQRLGIAAALLHAPQLLILDEPTNGLDPEGIIEMRTLLRDLADDGITIIISSHLLAEIDQIATTIGVIAKGQLIYQDAITEMRKLAKAELHLRTSDNTYAKQILGGHITAEVLRLPMMSDAKIAGGLMQLYEAGVHVYRLEERRNSLERIFLQMLEEANAT